MIKKSQPKPVDEPDTAQRLLDAAERLFGQHGYDGVGMRMLADEAKANLGAATYHFGSKEALYLETFLRRFRPTSAERLRLLSQAQAEAGTNPLPVEKIVDCMVRPPYLLGLNHPNFHTLLARSLFMPPPFLEAAIHQELGPNDEVFIKAFQNSLPNLPEDLIQLRTMFSMGALLMFSMEMGKLRPASNAKTDESFLRELIRFISAGLQSGPALAAQDLPPVPRRPRSPRKQEA